MHFNHARVRWTVGLCFALAMPACDALAQSQNAASFDVWEFRVLGNSTLPADEVERCVYSFLGPEKTLQDVEAARAALESVYHDRGYGTVFVDIPEQSVDDGIVRLHVTEGKVHRTRITGAQYFSGREIREKIPQAAESHVPHLPTLQAELAAVNAQTGDRVVTPILKAGPVPGTVDLTLKVEDHLPVHSSLELNNQYTADTSRLRALGSVSYDNLFAHYNSLSFQYQTSPQERREVDVLVASYVQQLEAGRWAFYYVHSNSNVVTGTTTASGSAASLGVLGKGNVFGSRFILPLANTAAGTHSLSFGAEYKDFIESIGTAGAGEAGLSTPISYLNLSAGYSGAWRGSRLQGSADVAFNFGARGLANDAGEFENKRYKARPNFFYLRSAASLGARLPADFTALWRFAGQYAVEPVISNEQYSIAGADGVRGYLEAEELADTGIKSSIQLGTPQLKWTAMSFAADAFVFYDIGKTGVIDVLPGESARTLLSSWGVGVNLAALKHFSAAVTWAYPLRDASHTRAGDSFVLFNVRGIW